MNDTYWTGSGRSSPSRARNSAISAGAALSPRIATAGSPERRTSRKTRVATPSQTGRNSRARRPTYFSTGRTSLRGDGPHAEEVHVPRRLHVEALEPALRDEHLLHVGDRDHRNLPLHERERVAVDRGPLRRVGLRLPLREQVLHGGIDPERGAERALPDLR